MADIDRARDLFAKAGLPFPAIPGNLAARLTERGAWLYSTRMIVTSPYDLDAYVEEAARPDLEDYVVLAHSGHGANSYAIQYYLVYRKLRMFLHLAWGGAYMNPEKTRVENTRCFDLADAIVRAVEVADGLPAQGWVTAVGSHFYGSSWTLPRGIPGCRDRRSRNPTEMLVEVLKYFDSLVN